MTPTLRIALAGNPNSGKTSVFNAITGAHQKVGNYPGVTVEALIAWRQSQHSVMIAAVRGMAQRTTSGSKGHMHHGVLVQAIEIAVTGQADFLVGAA